MAGSYNHITDENGVLVSNEAFVEKIENLGDAYEMAEEMFGMIWFLAQNWSDPAKAVELARSNYTDGLGAATKEKS